MQDVVAYYEGSENDIWVGRGWSKSEVLRCIERQGRRGDEGGGRSLRYAGAEGAMSIWVSQLQDGEAVIYRTSSTASHCLSTRSITNCCCCASAFVMALPR